MVTSSNKIAFDFDGTLVDVARRDWCVYTTLLDGRLGQAFEPLLFKPYWDLRRNKTVLSQLLPEGLNIDAYIAARNKLIERRIFLELDTVFPSVKDTLEKLARQFELWLVTSRKDDFELAGQLYDTGLYQQFEDRIVITSDKKRAFETMKPSFVVGDTEYDIQPAKELSIVSIALTTGIRNAECLRLLNPDWVIDDISQIPKLLLTDASSPTS